LFAIAGAVAGGPACKDPIFKRAAEFVRGDGVEVGGGLGPKYGPDVTHNGPDYNVDKKNSAEFEVTFPCSGTLELWIEHAAEGSRPVRILFDGNLVNESGISSGHR
jgi:hypothetical protein